MHRSQAEPTRYAALALLLAALLAVAVPAAQAANGSAIVSGVVRDSQGVAQMGALVQVLAGNSATIATAFTDTHGRYVISNLNAGRYLVRASASLFVPATRTNLQLRPGAVTVVNLTLAALFDTTNWLPAERRRADEPDDDWKWTLRSSANRPILRILEDGEVVEVSTSATETRPSVKTRVRETVTSGDGEFGAGGVHNVLALHRTLDTGADLIVRSDTGSTRVPSAYAPAQEFEAGYEQRQGFDGAARTVISYKLHPELVSAGAPGGLAVMSTTGAQRMSLGDLLQVEAGGYLEMVTAGASSVAAHPFLRVSTHPLGVWTLHYRMATDRTVQSFGSVTTGESQIPVALVKNGRLALESGRHQETSIDRQAGRGTVSVAYYHDVIARASVSGGGVLGPGASGLGSLSGQYTPGMMVDPSTGSFRTLAGGYTTGGARVTASAPLFEGLWVAAEYSTGSALASESGPFADFITARASLQAEKTQAATAAIKGRIKGSGTRLRASYRWQPAKFITAVDPFSTFSGQPFVSCQIRQPIRWSGRLPQGLDATIDVTNLLAQGYRPFVSSDGQTLYFAQAPRTVQGGLSFTF